MIVAISTADKDGAATNAMARSNPSTVAMNP
jgi:hypothetical protein